MSGEYKRTPLAKPYSDASLRKKKGWREDLTYDEKVALSEEHRKYERERQCSQRRAQGIGPRMRNYNSAQRSQRFKENNPARLAEIKKNYKIRNKEKLWEQEKVKRKNNVQHRIKLALRGSLRRHINKKRRTSSHIEELGCSIDHLKAHLESLWKPGMSWDNWTARGWHIDHKIPLCAFDLTDPTQLRIACHYTNLQPLWESENCSKQGKILHNGNHILVKQLSRKNGDRRRGKSLGSRSQQQLRPARPSY